MDNSRKRTRRDRKAANSRSQKSEVRRKENP
jgi:hypothetical protein